MNKIFLWGSSISGGQCEGGFDSRSESVVDIIPQGKETRFQYLNEPGHYLQRPIEFYPSQDGVEFTLSRGYCFVCKDGTKSIKIFCVMVTYFFR